MNYRVIPADLLAGFKTGDALARAAEVHAVQRGQFTLASGGISDVYFDARRLVMAGRDECQLVGTAIQLALRELQQKSGIAPSALAGVAEGGIPLVTAALMAAEGGDPRRGGWVRKATKEHGAKQRIEGCVWPGDRVVLLEDIRTTGASARQAVAVLQGAQVEVVAVLFLLDRAALNAVPGEPFPVPAFSLTRIEVVP